MNKSLITALMTATALVAVPQISAAQINPTVTHGAATITQAPGKTVIDQTTNRAAINWQQFGVRAGEEVRINQPGVGSVSLQTVTGNSISRIDGNLSSNGRVIISNPNGTLVGREGFIGAPGVLITTGRVDPNALMDTGNVRIDRTTTGKIIVDGTIKAARGGLTLVGQDVSTGPQSQIQVTGGSVNIAGAKAATVNFDGDKLISFQVTPETAASINPDGTMSQQAARDAVSGVVNLQGHIVSNSVTAQDGTVIFGSAVSTGIRITGDTVIQTGSITAPSQTVQIGGNDIKVSGRIDASGDRAGVISIGGGWQGAHLETGPNAVTTAVTNTASISANGKDQGGTISIWSDDKAQVGGTLSATGAKRGGQIETSGKHDLAIAPTIKVSTAGLKAGSWLIDPNAINVTSGGTDVLTGGILAATGAPGTTTIDPNLINSATGNVTLQATNSVQISSPISMSFAGAGLILQGSTISIGANVTTNNGSIVVRDTAGAGSASSFAKTSGVTLSLGTGHLDVKAGSITIASGPTTAGSVSLIGSTITNQTGSTINASGNISVSATGNIVNSATLSSSAPSGTVSLISSGGNVTNNTGALISSGSSGVITISGLNANLYGSETTGTSGSLTITGSSGVNLGGTLSSGTLDINAPSGAMLLAATTLQSDVATTINGTIDSVAPQALSFAGAGVISVSGDIGGTNPIASLSNGSASLSMSGSLTTTGAITSTGAISTGGNIKGSLVSLGAVTLSGDITVTSTGGSIAGSFNGPHHLKLESASILSYVGNSGGTTPLFSIVLTSTSALSNPVSLGGTLIASGAVTLDNGRKVSLIGDSSLKSSTAGVLIGNEIDGGYHLSIDSFLSPTIGGVNSQINPNIGGSVALAGLSISSAAPIIVNSTTIHAGSVSFSGTTSVTGSTITANGGIDINGTSNLSNVTFSANGSGAQIGLGATSNPTTLSGTNSFSGSGVAGNLNVRGLLTLAPSATLDANFSGIAHFGTITVGTGSTVTLSSSNNGGVDLDGGVTGTGTVSIIGTGRTISTQGNFGSNVTGFNGNSLNLLTGLTTISENTSSTFLFPSIGGLGSLSFTNSGIGTLGLASISSSVAGISISNQGDVTFANPLVSVSNLNVFSSSTINLPASVQTTGTSGFTGGLILSSGNSTFSSNGKLSFNGSLDAINGNVDTLSINPFAGGTILMNGAIGSTNPFATVTTAAGGTVGLGGNVTADTISLASSTLLLNNVTLSAAVSTLTPTPTLVSGSVDGPFSFAISGKPVSISSTMGGSTPLASFDLTGISTGTNSISGSIITTGNANFGSQAVNQTNALSVSATGGGNVNFGSTIDGASNLSISTNTGTIGISGAIGGGTPLANVSISTAGAASIVLPNINASTISVTGPSSVSGTLSASGAINLAGDTSLSNASLSGSSVTVGATGKSISLTGSTVLTANGGPVSISDLTGTGNLTINGATTSISTANSTTSGTVSFAPTSPAIINFQGIFQAGAIVGLGSNTVAIGNNVATITSLGATPISLGTVTSSGGSLTVNSGGDLSITTSISNLANAAFRAGNTGTLSFSAGTTIAPTGALVVHGGAINSLGTLSAGGSVTVASDNAATFASAIGGTGSMLIKTATGGRGINVGTNTGGVLYLSGTDVSTLSTGRSGFQIGDATSGTVTFSAPITRTGNLAIGSGSAISIASPLTVTGGTLGMSAPLVTMSASITGSIFTNGAQTKITSGSYGSITVATGSLVLQGGTFSSAPIASAIQAQGNITLMTGGTLANVTETGALSLNGGGPITLTNFNQAGFSLNSTPALTINGGTLKGSINSTGNLTLSGAQSVTGATTITGIGNTISINGSMTGPGPLTLSNGASGRIINSGSISLSGGNIVWTSGTITSTGAISGGQTNLTASAVSLGGSGLTSTGPVAITAPTLTGTISAAGQAVSLITSTVTASITGGTLQVSSVAPGSPSGAIMGTIGGKTDGSFITVINGPVPGSLTFNGSAIKASSATIATKASVASVASTPSSPTVAVVSVPVIIEQPKPIILAVTTVSPISATIQAVLPQILTILSSNPGSRLGFSDSESETNSGSSLFTVITGVDRTQSPISDQPINAAEYSRVVSQTPSGSLIPRGASQIGETGAVLVNTQTIKVDASDTGGAGGQVIAFASRPTALIPGLLFQSSTNQTRPLGDEPPLSDQPSTLNEEMLMD
jgi:fibronectin-binding autotransporter adhesin